MGSIAKSIMRKGFLLYEEMRKYLTIPYMIRPFVTYDFGSNPFWVSLYMRKILFSFLSVCPVLLLTFLMAYLFIINLLTKDGAVTRSTKLLFCSFSCETCCSDLFACMWCIMCGSMAIMLEPSFSICSLCPFSTWSWFAILSRSWCSCVVGISRSGAMLFLRMPRSWWCCSEFPCGSSLFFFCRGRGERFYQIIIILKTFTETPYEKKSGEFRHKH